MPGTRLSSFPTLNLILIITFYGLHYLQIIDEEIEGFLSQVTS